MVLLLYNSVFQWPEANLSLTLVWQFHVLASEASISYSIWWNGWKVYMVQGRPWIWSIPGNEVSSIIRNMQNVVD